LRSYCECHIGVKRRISLYNRDPPYWGSQLPGDLQSKLAIIGGDWGHLRKSGRHNGVLVTTSCVVVQLQMPAQSSCLVQKWRASTVFSLSIETGTTCDGKDPFCTRNKTTRHFNQDDLFFSERRLLPPVVANTDINVVYYQCFLIL
jgi:hypothetical protein